LSAPPKNVVRVSFDQIRFRSSFICQDTLTRRQWSDLCGLRVKLPTVTTSLTTQR